jgi:hypothetical protein
VGFYSNDTKFIALNSCLFGNDYNAASDRWEKKIKETFPRVQNSSGVYYLSPHFACKGMQNYHVISLDRSSMKANSAIALKVYSYITDMAASS